MNIVVTGGSGMIGRNIKDIIEESNTENTFHFLSSKDVDLTKRDDVLNFFNDKNYVYLYYFLFFIFYSYNSY